MAELRSVDMSDFVVADRELLAASIPDPERVGKKRDLNADPRGLSQRIGRTALGLFLAHGFESVKMAHIAELSGLSRTALYLRFSSKALLFEAVAESLVIRSLRRAASSWVDGAPLRDNISNVLLNAQSELLMIETTSLNGRVLIGPNGPAARLFDKFSEDLAQIIYAKVAVFDGVVDLSNFGDALGYARFMVRASIGLRNVSRTAEDFRESIARLATLLEKAISNGITPDCPQYETSWEDRAHGSAN